MKTLIPLAVFSALALSGCDGGSDATVDRDITNAAADADPEVTAAETLERVSFGAQEPLADKLLAMAIRDRVAEKLRAHPVRRSRHVGQSPSNDDEDDRGGRRRQRTVRAWLAGKFGRLHTALEAHDLLLQQLHAVAEPRDEDAAQQHDDDQRDAEHEAGRDLALLLRPVSAASSRRSAFWSGGGGRCVA